MCIGDWRLGRLIRTNAYTQTPGIGGTYTVRANPQRVGLTIQSFQTNTVIGQSLSIAVDNVTVLFLPPTSTIFHCTFLSHGDLPTRKFDITTPGTATVIGIIEYTLPEEFIAAALDEFKRSLRL